MDVETYKSKYRKVNRHEPNLFLTIMHDCGKLAYYDLTLCTYLDEIVDIAPNRLKTDPSKALW